MGDRRMAEIRTEEGSLYFYTHSTGFALPGNAKRALELATPRKNDIEYALRRVVDYLIFTSGSRDSEVGSGLMFSPNCEDEYGGNPHSVVIDMVNWKVTSTDME